MASTVSVATTPVSDTATENELTATPPLLLSRSNSDDVIVVNDAAIAAVDVVDASATSTDSIITHAPQDHHHHHLDVDNDFVLTRQRRESADTVIYESQELKCYPPPLFAAGPTIELEQLTRLSSAGSECSYTTVSSSSGASDTATYSRIQVSRFTKVHYTHAADDYDRTSVDMAVMGERDWMQWERNKQLMRTDYERWLVNDDESN